MSDGAMSKKVEKHFLELGRQAFLNEFPNPERMGCPGSQVLKSLAAGKIDGAEEDRWIDHCASCSPCYRDLDQFRRAFTRQRRLRLLSAAAIVIAAICGGTWLAVNRGVKTHSGGAIVENIGAKGAVQTEVLDLRGWSAVRSDEAAPNPSGKRLELHRRLLALTIYLPMESQPGKYQVEILRSHEKPLLTFESIARIENRKTVLNTRADLSKLAVGSYMIGIRQPPWDWRFTRSTSNKCDYEARENKWKSWGAT